MIPYLVIDSFPFRNGLCRGPRDCQPDIPPPCCHSILSTIPLHQDLAYASACAGMPQHMLRCA